MCTKCSCISAAAELILLQVRGKMSCLLINDIDAGLGHFANTQVWKLCMPDS